METKFESEIELQRKLYHYLSDPSNIFTTISGKRLQILSPGKHNKLGGPDFNDIAMLLEGNIIIGDAEFHKKSSEWLIHNHNNDYKYKKVVLHIVNENDIVINGMETLIIPIEDLVSKIEIKELSYDYESIEEIKNFALYRLLRKSAEVQRILKQNNLKEALRESLRYFIERYSSRRRRPVYKKDDLSMIIDNVLNSFLYEFLEGLEIGDSNFIPDKMLVFLKTKIKDEGPHLRREIILNCILPIALCLANDEARIGLLFWYWSTPALNSYGKLFDRFPRIPQNYLWQQQGMLEFMKMHGNNIKIDSEVIDRFGFDEVLSFYKIGGTA